jgi:hypothetical protein
LRDQGGILPPTDTVFHYTQVIQPSPTAAARAGEDAAKLRGELLPAVNNLMQMLRRIY